MEECQLPKLDVTGSSPVSRSIFNSLGNPTRKSYCDYCAKTADTHWITIASSFRTPSNFCAKSELAYTSRLTPTPCPR